MLEYLDRLLGRSDDLFDRDLIGFPEGNNETDTVIGGVHFNLTTLEHWNYTLYDNGTVSNGSKCWLTYEPYTPAILETNGSWVNATKCYSAVDPIGARGYTGIGFAVAFGICLVAILTCLAKHGRIYLQKEKRFYPIGRRWQWYWAAFTCAAALISLFVNVDVDRYHVQELPLIVTVFFFYLLCWGTTALVWEAVRHWGSWQQRQYVDPDPFILSDEDQRSKIEFYLPLWFYFWLWLNFFMVVPRSWKFVPRQRSPEQEAEYARPGATDGRFKAAGFCLFVCWLTIVFSLRHSVKHYKPRNRGIFNRSLGFVRAIPIRLAIIIVLSLGTIAYQEYIAWDYDFSVVKADGPVAIIYGWGYGCSLLIMIVQVAYGWASPNEDRELIRQRRARGEMLDRELGIVHKPAWWKRVRGDHLLSYKDKLTRQVQEVGGARGVGRREMGPMEAYIRDEDLRNARNNDIELSPMSPSGAHAGSDNPRVDRAGAKTKSTGNAVTATDDAGLGHILPNTTDLERQRRIAYLTEDGPPPYADQGRHSVGRSGSTTSTDSVSPSINAPPQHVRSMLDV
ncbi:hypothetical protein LIA77_01081 [Sarocladium implicatum]|nr:hypothetical protein LIA77_01081 [Sarocladium implicatum]